MTLQEAQDLVEANAPFPYYADEYRGFEADYLPALCDLLAEFQPSRVLEIGPGWGTMMVWLAAQGWEVTVAEWVQMGTFLTQEFLAMIGAQWEQLDTCEKALAGRQFDLILMTQVLPHLKWHPLAAVQHCAEMLAPGGTCVVSALNVQDYPNIETPYGTNWQAVPHYKQAAAPEAMVVVMYSIESLHELLGTAFEDVTVFQPEGSTVMFGQARRAKKVSR